MLLVNSAFQKKKSIAFNDAFLGGSSPNQGWEEGAKG
jgi:hypothetical protein